MLRWLLAIVIAGIVSAFAFLLLTGEYVNDGAVLVELSEDRGIHEGDVLVLAGWAAALLSVAGMLSSAGNNED